MARRAVFYDHYFDLLTYLHARKERLATFKTSVASRSLPTAQANAEWTSYKGRERVILRKRRTKLKLDQFHILTQVGQGGYGEVYLARHKETHQVVALKKLRKRTLLKMDEVRFVFSRPRPPEKLTLLACRSDTSSPNATSSLPPVLPGSFASSTPSKTTCTSISPWCVLSLSSSSSLAKLTTWSGEQDFIAGGDFRTLLNNSGVLKEEHARFYISEMFCAVSELHKLGYIHRDLKPEARPSSLASERFN